MEPEKSREVGVVVRGVSERGITPGALTLPRQPDHSRALWMPRGG